MKLVVVLFVFACAFISAQEIQDWKNDPKFLQAASVFLPSSSCEQQLVVPLALLLYPTPVEYNHVCSTSTIYFQGCRDPTLIDCNKKFPSDDTCSTYMYWIDAFVAGGKKFTCSVGIENITNIHVYHGGLTCTLVELGYNLSKSVIDLQTFLSTPKSISCSDMKAYIQGTLTLLDSCESKALFNLTQKYFEKVVNESPCRDALNSGAGEPYVVNCLVFISTVMFYIVISFIL